MRIVLALGLALLSAPTLAQDAGRADAKSVARPLPVIDMHLHAFKLGFAAGAPACPGDQNWVLVPIDPQDEFTPESLGPCAGPIVAPTTDEALMRASIAMLERLNIRRAVTSGDIADVTRWRAAAPDRIIPAIGFATPADLPIAEMRRLHGEGAIQVFAEVSAQYRGVEAGDARYEPYFALAEELDIPVGVHLGEGPPSAGRFPGYETYRVRLSSAFQLEEVLRKHPRLRVYVMHYGSPLVDDMIAMLFTYPNLYVDVGWNVWGMRRVQFHDHLKRLIDGGYEKRIMFGSDQMYWPDAIAESIEGIESATFLTSGQKRDIFYNNAARFLRLTPEEIAADHGP